jgi:hypothetical protein
MWTGISHADEPETHVQAYYYMLVTYNMRTGIPCTYYGKLWNGKRNHYRVLATGRFETYCVVYGMPRLSVSLETLR